MCWARKCVHVCERCARVLWEAEVRHGDGDRKGKMFSKGVCRCVECVHVLWE